MASPRVHKHSQVRGFERALRIQGLVDAGLLTSASEVPADAVPASVAAARVSRRLFYRDMVFRCRDCGAESVWSAEEQRFWFERTDGARQSVATRCAACRHAMRERNRPKPAR